MIVDAVAESHGWARSVAVATNAFFHAAEDEDICGECLPEFKDQLAAEGEDTDVLFKFVKKVYGRRDGPQVMCQKNLIRCEALPCFFWHENLHILVELRDEMRLKFSEIVYPGMRHSHHKASRLGTSQGTLIVASSRYDGNAKVL